MRMRAALAGLALLGTVGCASMEPMVVPVAFDPQAGSWILERGSGSIGGQAFLRQQGGGVVTCAGAMVGVLPATAYATERMRLLYQSTERGFNQLRRVEDAPMDYQQQTRQAQCDAQGRFRIADLPPGEYYLVTRVVWAVGGAQQGGSIMRRVRLAPGQNAEVILTSP
jgi:hypothetical protein